MSVALNESAPRRHLLLAWRDSLFILGVHAKLDTGIRCLPHERDIEVTTPLKLVPTQWYLINLCGIAHEDVVTERLGSGDGERETLMRRQMPCEAVHA
jgi:hypothetical protein